jgi:mutator protein MutT
MSYIGDLRKQVGHDLIMTVGCGILIMNDKGQVLLQRRSDTGDWCIPGGALEPFETYEEAAIREVREEVGITAENLKLFGIYSGDERRIHYPNDDVVYSLSVIFTADEYEGIISDRDSEVLEHRFFGRDEIPEELFPADSRAILDWKKGINEVMVH